MSFCYAYFVQRRHAYFLQLCYAFFMQRRYACFMQRHYTYFMQRRYANFMQRRYTYVMQHRYAYFMQRRYAYFMQRRYTNVSFPPHTKRRKSCCFNLILCYVVLQIKQVSWVLLLIIKFSFISHAGVQSLLPPPHFHSSQLDVAILQKSLSSTVLNN